jgi:hypothetical protein
MHLWSLPRAAPGAGASGEKWIEVQDVSPAQSEVLSVGWSAVGQGEGKRLTHGGSLAVPWQFLHVSFAGTVEDCNPLPINAPPWSQSAFTERPAKFRPSEFRWHAFR